MATSTWNQRPDDAYQYTGALLGEPSLLAISVVTSLTGLDYPSVTAVYKQFKGWLCCDLTDQLFKQWVACVVLVVLAWVTLQCALAVLKNLDSLSGEEKDMLGWG
jgi:hypothetical protein